jgi:exonuclease III
MKIVSWNMNKATSERIKSWEYLSNLNPDLALLQEVNSIPDFIKDEFDCLYEKATNKSGLPQKFGTAVLVKGKIGNLIQLTSESSWVNKKLQLFSGNFVAAEVILEDGFQLSAISVHSPAWIINLAGLEKLEFSELKLKNSRDIWGTELLWSALINLVSKSNVLWIVGGDFNSSPTFDVPKNRGNQEVLDRMNALDLKECLFHSRGFLTSTFKNPSNQKVIHQIDHLFVSSVLVEKLKNCKVEAAEIIFDSYLSDHLPIIANFN